LHEWRWTRALATLLLAGSLAGCYQSDSPIADAATAPLDARLPGQWRCVTDDSAETALLSITAVSPTRFDATLGAADEKPSRYQAHSARLDGVALANVQELEEDGTPRQWVLARYALLRPNVLEVSIASDDALKGPDTAGAPRERARRHLKAGDLFDQFCVCVRVKAASAPATRAAPAPSTSPSSSGSR
jgi:hypothetical protein